jgi:hypothetical protein
VSRIDIVADSLGDEWLVSHLIDYGFDRVNIVLRKLPPDVRHTQHGWGDGKKAVLANPLFIASPIDDV